MNSTTRREFISNATKAGMGLWVAGNSSLLNGRIKKPEGKLGVALMGLGNFSRESIAPEIASSKYVWFAGVITGDTEGKGKAWAKQYGFPEENIYHYNQIAQLRNNPDIDFVHVVTPTGIHASNTIAVAKAGKHVLCEKPMAISSRECKMMIEECKKAGVLLGINYRLHWEPHHLKMMELTKSKTYGEMKSIVTDFSWLRGNNKPWLLDKALAGGGAFFDTGVYTVQAGCYLTGEMPVRVTAIPNSTSNVYPSDIEETMSVIFEFPGGAVMSARASYSYNNHLCIVSSENGAFSGEGSVFGQSSNGKPSFKSIKLPDGNTFKAEDTLQLAVIHDAFAEAIKNKTTFKTPGEMGLRDILIVEAVYRSAASGKTETIIYG